MKMNKDDIRMDYERLRRDLLEYFGTAAFSGFPIAVIELIDVERASERELIKLARMADLNLAKYQYDFSEDDSED